MHDERDSSLPHKGFLRVHERPSCLSCTRLKGLEGPDTDEGGKDPFCAFVGGTPSSLLCSGEQACEGYDPRPIWDFVIPVDKSRSASGAILVAPGGKTASKPRPRDVVVLIAPERDAILIPPTPRVPVRADDTVPSSTNAVASTPDSSRRLDAPQA